MSRDSGLRRERVSCSYCLWDFAAGLKGIAERIRGIWGESVCGGLLFTYMSNANWQDPAAGLLISLRMVAVHQTR